MASTSQIVSKLNDILATERRQAAMYRRCASMLTGPYRDSLAGEFKDHAATEDSHAEIAARRIMALDGDLSADIKDIPIWHSLQEALNGIETLEEEGIRAWQELMNMLPSNDAFRHVIEGVLEREQEHWDEAKRWKRTDYAEKSMKTPGDIGSIVPLNLASRAHPFVDTMFKSESHEERMWAASRAGTPPTKRGAYNGAMPATLPSVALENNPFLYLGKAVVNPAMAGSGAQDATPRKRDPATGKFSESPVAGPETTAEDDASDAARAAKLSQRRYGTKSMANKAFGDEAGGAAGGGPMFNKPKPQMPPQGGIPSGPPGMGTPAAGAMGAAQPQAGDQPMGMTPDGMPIHDDPYHPDHAQFTPEHHQAAADMHNQQAEMSTNSGRIPTALDHQLKARIHGDLANDSKSPMERVLSRQGMPGAAQGDGNQMPGMPGQDTGGMPPNAAASADSANQMPEANGGGMPPNAAASADNAPGNDPMDSFLAQLPDAQPGQQNMNPDQNKPNFGSPAGNQGPLPRMTNTQTGSPIGPQSQSMQHAGTISQPEQMPPSPSDGSSMPDISGAGAPPAGGGQFSSAPPSENSFDVDGEDNLDDEKYDAYNEDDPMAMDGEAPDSGAGAPDESEIPDSNAGAPDEVDEAELEDQPTPGSSESEPSLDAGPSTSDSKPASAANGPFTGNPLDAKKQEMAEKSFSKWLTGI